MSVEMIEWGPGQEFDWERTWRDVPEAEQVSRCRWIWIMIHRDEPITARFQIAGCRWEVETVYGCYHPIYEDCWVQVVVYRRTSDAPECSDAG